MLESLAETYTLADASMEIFIMLLGAFVLGIILGWLLKPSRYVVQKVVSASELAGTSYVASKKSQTKNIAPKTIENATIETVRESPPVVNMVSETKGDNLQMIEGVGPKLEKLLNKN